MKLATALKDQIPLRLICTIKPLLLLMQSNASKNSAARDETKGGREREREREVEIDR